MYFILINYVQGFVLEVLHIINNIFLTYSRDIMYGMLPRVIEIDTRDKWGGRERKGGREGKRRGESEREEGVQGEGRESVRIGEGDTGV